MKERQLVWAICFYLVVVYVFFGITCFLVWDRSSIFQVIGWSWDHPGSENLQKILYSLCAGTFGATSYSFWQLFRYYCHLKKFDSAWTVWYVFGPISGGLLGIATYSVVVGGLLVLGESVTLRSNWAIFALSFLTGFSAKRVLRKLHAIAGQIFQEVRESTRTTTCSNCGAEVEEKARFCPSCGKEIERAEKSELAETADVPSQNNKGALGDV